MDLISNFSNIYCSVDSAWDKWSFKYNQIEGGVGGAGHPDPLIKKKKFFGPSGPQFDLKIRK